MDSSFALTNVAAICLLTLLGAIFLLFHKKIKFHQESKTITSCSSSLSLSPPPSSLPLNWIHHVFPSFHGADVRKTFLSHILKEFERKGINPFIDNDIVRGKSIGPELIEAIKGSRIAIVLLSKNYASSTWCLDELVQIMKCKEEFGQTVMTLFYEVDPTDVKKQTGDFGKVFRITCKGKTKESIGRWRQALAEAATIAGEHSSNWDNEANMIEKIAIDVSNELNISAPSSDFDGLVGMRSHMRNMGSLLRLDSKEVRMIGIWGPSGIGKTTIARFLFNQHSKKFQLSIFVNNIKGRYNTMPTCSNDYDVKLYLQQQFLSQIINHEGTNIPHLGIIKDRLKDKKVLVVLDDVNQLVQLEAMAKETWFGAWSRIIVTTQDRKLLRAHGINHIYKVDFPSSREALKMFCMYAFDQNYPKDGFRMLAWEVTRLVGKLPLGLRVMGSYFRGMSTEEWTMELPRVKNRLGGDIENILKLSYDALYEEDKKLFLHIACFFNGESVGSLEDHLAHSFKYVTHGLRVLAEKSLISMDREVIRMHDLLVRLGKEIVRKQYENEPWKRQFLVDERDIDEVFNNDEADSSNVIGIDLRESKIACTSERTFERLHNLQFLRISTNWDFPQNLSFISQKLRMLHWKYFEMSCLSSYFQTKFLVSIDMPESKLEKLWEGIQPLSNLKWMNMDRSRILKEVPDLSTATNLKKLELSRCSSLVGIPSSIGHATNLQELNLFGCSSLVELPSSIGNAINLQKLNLRVCSSLVELPDSIGNAINLQELNLNNCYSLVELPSTIGNATNLQVLNLIDCSSLLKLPTSIGNAINLQKLNLRVCSSLVELPVSIGNAINLQELDLGFCSSLVELPSSIGNAINLQKLDLSHCSSLVKLPSSIGNAINLQELKLMHCSSLVKLPSSIGNAINLQKLNLHVCSSLVELPASIGNAINLQDLDLGFCSSLVELPSSIGNATNLQNLHLNNCYNMVEIPSSIGNLRRLSKLDLSGCSKLEVFPINILESPEELDLTNCSQLKSFRETSSTNIEDFEVVKEEPLSPTRSLEIQDFGPWIGRISRLRRLKLDGMKKLVSLPFLPYSLLELDATGCESLERLDCSFRNPDICLRFDKCFKLNQEARNLVINTPTNEYAVLPGREVPECFTYRATGSSLTVKLNQNTLGTSTKFKACIILDKESRESDVKYDGSRADRNMYCYITSKQNALAACISEKRNIENPYYTEHMYTFEVEAEEVTSTELDFEFKLGNVFSYGNWGIKECGVFQLGDDKRS